MTVGELTAFLEASFPGLHAVFGGKELSRSAAALASSDAQRQQHGEADANQDSYSSHARPGSPATPSSSTGGAGMTASGSSPATRTSAVAHAVSHCLKSRSDMDLSVRELALAVSVLELKSAQGTHLGAASFEGHTTHEQGHGQGQSAPAHTSQAALQPGAAGGSVGSGAVSGGEVYERLYNHGQMLQELAGSMSHAPADHVALLREACAKYSAAAAAQPTTSAEPHYNAGVALSELAAALKGSAPQEARDVMQGACAQYAAAYEADPGHLLALNNWGLVLQMMSAAEPSPSGRQALTDASLEKFRHAIRLQPGFDRGCYNLGTVLYTRASSMQTEFYSLMQAGRLASSDADTARERYRREAAVREAYCTAAQYIALAAALQGNREVYRTSLKRVKTMLPLPFIRAGYLTVPATHTLGTVNESWRREWFVLDQHSLRSASSFESALSTAAVNLGGGSAGGAGRGGGGVFGSVGGAGPKLLVGHDAGEKPLALPLEHIVSVRRVEDPSLPEGVAISVMLTKPLTIYNLATSSGGFEGGALSPSTSGSLSPSFPAASPSPMHTPAHASGNARSTSDAWHAAGKAAEAPERLFGDGKMHANGPSMLAQYNAHAGLHARSCIYLLCEDAGSADAWVDALLLSYHVVATRGPNALADALVPADLHVGTPH